jgi:hypothetical protein
MLVLHTGVLVRRTRAGERSWLRRRSVCPGEPVPGSNLCGSIQIAGARHDRRSARIAWNSIAQVALLSYLSGGGVSSAAQGGEVCRAPGVRGRVGSSGSCARGRPALLWFATVPCGGSARRCFDGVIALGEALRPLGLWRPSTRTWRQRHVGSRPRCIGVTGGVARTIQGHAGASASSPSSRSVW